MFLAFLAHRVTNHLIKLPCLHSVSSSVLNIPLCPWATAFHVHKYHSIFHVVTNLTIAWLSSYFYFRQSRLFQCLQFDSDVAYFQATVPQCVCIRVTVISTLLRGSCSSEQCGFCEAGSFFSTTTALLRAFISSIADVTLSRFACLLHWLFQNKLFDEKFILPLTAAFVRVVYAEVLEKPSLVLFRIDVVENPTHTSTTTKSSLTSSWSLFQSASLWFGPFPICEWKRLCLTNVHHACGR